MDLSKMRAPAGSRKKEKRVGRGRGSGHGKTSCRGMKGLGARQGSGIKFGFEGGQMPLARRLPKWGFASPFPREYQVVNLAQLARFPAGTVVEFETLWKAGLVRRLGGPVKLLAEGDVAHALKLTVNRASKSAIEKVQAKGGSVTIIETPWAADEAAAAAEAAKKAAENEAKAAAAAEARAAAKAAKAAAKPEKGEKGEKGERPPKGEKPEKAERAEKADRPPKGEPKPE
jgi:large subunit ribosomal protein L15